MLEGVDGRQYESRTEAAGEPSERPRPEAGAQRRHAPIDRLDMALPILGMSFFDRRQTPVYLGQLRVFLGLRQGPVKCGAVDLALQVGGVAPPRVLFRHRRTSLCPGCLSYGPPAVSPEPVTFMRTAGPNSFL